MFCTNYTSSNSGAIILRLIRYVLVRGNPEALANTERAVAARPASPSLRNVRVDRRRAGAIETAEILATRPLANVQGTMQPGDRGDGGRYDSQQNPLAFSRHLKTPPIRSLTDPAQSVKRKA
jgi:hypothetical protein